MTDVVIRHDFTFQQRDALLTALIGAAVSWADPSTIIECLEVVWPQPVRPWREIVYEIRDNL